MIDVQKPRATSNAASLFKKNKLLTLDQIYLFKSGVNMFKIFNNLQTQLFKKCAVKQT